MKKIFNYITVFAVLFLTACTGDLDVTPLDPNKNTTVDADALFNKCYAILALQGDGGADGDSDGLDAVVGDGGTTPFLRQMFNVNELPTDEAICAWGDPGIPEYNNATWTADHPMINGFYYRLYLGVTICNHFLEVAGDYDATYTAEVRFLRALYYYYLMDTFGDVPFTDAVSSENPKQIGRANLFAWIESELLDIEGSLSAATPKKSTDEGYGRADKAACWLLLSRMYLNAEVYTGTAQWAKAAEYAEKVINSGYKLNSSSINGYSAYQSLFMADNGETAAAYEAILPVMYQGNQTTSWGGTLFYMASTFKDDMHPIESNPSITNGTTAAWAGNRAQPELLAKFFPNGDAPNVASYEMTKAANDDRAIFWGLDRTLTIEEYGDFTDGFSVAKFLNVRTDGGATTDSQHPDTDFFLMRLAEAYLNYAEATARENGNSATSQGTAYLNTLRARSNAAAKSGYTLDDILDEWSREFYFEGRRRIDLVRYGYFGGSNSSKYVWQFKGGATSGRSIAAYRNVYAIPASDITANSNLVQNPGY